MDKAVQTLTDRLSIRHDKAMLSDISRDKIKVDIRMRTADVGSVVIEEWVTEGNPMISQVVIEEVMALTRAMTSEAGGDTMIGTVIEVMTAGGPDGARAEMTETDEEVGTIVSVMEIHVVITIVIAIATITENAGGMGASMMMTTRDSGDNLRDM